MKEILSDVFGGALTACVVWIINLVVIATRGLALLAGTILDWVTGPNFAKWGYTQNNPIVEIGLGITKQFVNLGLVAALIVIAFAITLRIKEYGAKKTLAKLIIIALLVNFAPVVVGLIVDASNIVMNYFLGGVRTGISGILSDISQKQTDSLINKLFEGRVGLGTQISVIVMVIVHIVLNISIAFAFILLASIFIFRYIIIWLLTILSPLAFVALILPATKKFWDKWWEQLIQWSIIGIPMAFFLYLAMASFSKLSYDFTQQLAFPGLGEELTVGFAMVLPYILTLILLYLGFIMGLTTSAMGANSIINFTKSKGRATAGWAGRKGWGATKWAGRRGLDIVREKTPEKWQKFGQRQAAAQRWGEQMTGLKGVAMRTLTAPVYHARRGFGKVIGGTPVEKQKDRIKEAADSVKDVTPATALEKFHKAGRLGDTALQTGIINGMIEQGKIKNIMDKDKFGDSAITESKVETLLQNAKKWDSDSIIKKAFPHIAAKHIADDDKEFIEAKKKDPRITTKESFILSKMKPADYKNISEEALENIDVVDGILNTAMGSHVSQLIEQHGRIAAKALERGIAEGAGKNNVEKPKDWLININPRLHKYLTRGAGASLIEIPERRIIITPPSTPPGGGQPITVKTIKEEIKKSKTEGLPTMGEEIRKQRGKK